MLKLWTKIFVFPLKISCAESIIPFRIILNDFSLRSAFRILKIPKCHFVQPCSRWIMSCAFEMLSFCINGIFFINYLSAVQEFSPEFGESLNNQPPFSLRRHLAPLLYADVYRDNRIDTGIFGFRREGAVIPLHNHPQMSGFLRVIRGSIKVII